MLIGHALPEIRLQHDVLTIAGCPAFGKTYHVTVEAQTMQGESAKKEGFIVIVDDDPDVRLMLTSYLEAHNISARAVSNRLGLQRCLREQPNLVVLDLRLGKDDGLHILREIRSRSDIPVIVITGDRHGQDESIRSLDLGADCYLLKPFVPRELLARIRAVLRRQELGRLARYSNPNGGEYRFGGWRFERRSRTLIDPEGTPVELSNKLGALLLAFLEAPDRPLTREQLIEATRIREDVFDRSLDVQIVRLRRKLQSDPGLPVIQTVRGVGYRFALPVDAI
jgi:two-component system, OmpR family, response regulator